ncbi:hypothetical protein B0I73DRAFT_137538 [Yarrowia lipolytica]|uniref:Uncharacterized protein n=1 Tax=Yarrowia lipolytica TaxID=4952 RepID=A0A371BYP3_YARLL|nr:hypothetical protein B0I71DRAFT_136317 [Yarrowia lipolytica]RDW36176.1 hypothetical protein B0I73DRAFT_137538 [Yarrowia lipolytica]RDW43167.1 hypothetical protein B0I74DRAFT_142486 [Yarrowia lipolytica]RDW49940.1 hypothetical protein B0I75DRAFT_142307 [Yarrowia lipolytica]
MAGHTLGDGGSNHEHELGAVDSLSANDIGKNTETKLSNDGGHLEQSGSGGGGLTGTVDGLTPVDVSHHGDTQVNGEDIVGISHETNTGDGDGSNVLPAEAGVVNLLQGESSSLVGVLNVSKVVDIVVEGGVSTFGHVVIGH